MAVLYLFILLLARATDTAAAAILVVATITIQQMVASLLAPGCRQADHRVKNHSGASTTVQTAVTRPVSEPMQRPISIRKLINVRW